MYTCISKPQLRYYSVLIDIIVPASLLQVASLLACSHMKTSTVKPDKQSLLGSYRYMVHSESVMILCVYILYMYT